MFKVKRGRKSKISIFLIAVLLFKFVFPLKGLMVNAESNLVDVSVSSPSSIVMGKSKAITVNFSNKQGVYLYNIGAEIVLEPGLEFVEGSSNNIKPFKITKEEVVFTDDLGRTMKKTVQKVIWKDIKDLAKNETYSFGFNVKSIGNTEYKDNKGAVKNHNFDFGHELSGKVRAAASTDPQLFPTENQWTTYKNFNMIVEPFEVIISGGGEHLKGAGEYKVGEEIKLDDANRKYGYTITLINNEKYSTKITNLTNKIASEIEVQNFSMENRMTLIKNVLKDKKNYGEYYNEVILNNIDLALGETKTITYDAAIFNRFTTEDGNINGGDIIQDNTSLSNNLVYSGYITDSTYQGDKSKEYTNKNDAEPLKATTIAKDIIIGKSVSGVSGSNPSRIKYNDEFEYTLNVKVNGYYDLDDIVVTDTIGDGQTYVDGSALPVTNGDSVVINPEVAEEQADGTRVITWNIGKIKYDDNPSRALKLHTTVDMAYCDNKTPIVANDSLINNANVKGQGMPNYRVDDTNPIRLATDSSSASIRAGIPSISKEIIAIHGKNIGDKLQVGDVVTFRITYTANLGVKQKNVVIEDILPLGLKVADSDPISYGAGWPTTICTETINGNRDIVTWTFSEELSENINTLSVDLKTVVQDIPEVTIDKQDENLAKLSFNNTPGNVDSDRDAVTVKYCGSKLDINKNANKTSGLKSADVINFTITVNNDGDGPAYDVVVKDVLPTELENIQINTNDANIVSNTNGNELSFTIKELDKNTSINLEYQAAVINGIGSKFSMTNSADIKGYKKVSSGREYTDQNTGTNVRLSTNEPSIEKTIIDKQHDPLRIGDWVGYKVAITVPEGTTAYNAKLIDILPAGYRLKDVYKNYVDQNSKGISVDYANSGSINIDLGNVQGGTYNYYIETIINNLPGTTNTAELSYSNKSTGGQVYKINDTAVQAVNIPNLTSKLDRADGKDDTMLKGDTDKFTYTITNNGQNTAYDFVPVIKIPSEFEASNFVINGANHGAIIPTSESDANETYNVYTLPKVDVLEKSAQYPTNLDITLKNNRGAGEVIDFTGYTGDYYTHDDDSNSNRKKLTQHSDSISVKIPSIEIMKTVIKTDYDNSKTELRPGDEIQYNINIKVYGGANVYNLKVIDTLPDGLTLVSMVDDNTSEDISKNNFIVKDVIKSDDVTTYNLTVKAKANANYNFSNPKNDPLINKVKATWNTKETGGELKETTEARANINLVQPLLNIIGFNNIDKVFNNGDEVKNCILNVKNNGNATGYNGIIKIAIPDFVEATGDTSEYTVVTENDVKYLKWENRTINAGVTMPLNFDLKLLSDGSAEVSKSGKLRAEIVSYDSLLSDGKKYNSSDSASKTVSVANPTYELYVIDKNTAEAKKEVFTEDKEVVLRNKITLPKGTKIYDGKIEIELSDYIDKDTLVVSDGINREKSSVETRDGKNYYKFNIPSNYTLNGNNQIVTDIKRETVENSPAYKAGITVNTGELKWFKDSKSIKDTAEVGLIAINVTKNASTLNPLIGEEITYTITVENRGSETLNNIRVVDVMPKIDLDTTIGTLTPGQKEVIQKKYPEVVESDFIGEAPHILSNTVNVEVVYNETKLTDSAEIEVNLLRNHALEVKKIADIKHPMVGDTVTYTITVKNVSPDREFTNVTVTDKMIDILDKSIGTLKKGDSATFTGTYKVTSISKITNIATAQGYDGVNLVRESAQETIIVNTPPQTKDELKETDEDKPVRGKIEGRDVDNAPLSFIKESDPKHGSVVVNTDGTWTYTPEQDYNNTPDAPDSFQVKVYETAEVRAYAVSTVTIVVNPLNDAPRVSNYPDKTTPEETTVSGRVVGKDPEGDDITYSKGSDPSNGSAVVNEDGTWVYTPIKDFNGEDSFTVIVEDDKAASTVSTITINVTPVNDPPTVPDYTDSTYENTPVTGNVVGSDVDGNSLEYSINIDPRNGIVKVNADGSWKYTPNSGFIGQDDFKVTVDDKNGETVISTISIGVRRRPIIHLNHDPTVPDYSKETKKNTKVTGRVCGEDADGERLKYWSDRQPKNGKASVDSDGNWTYTPKKDFVGTDNFKVKLTDGRGGTAVSKINIKVIDDNNPPTVPDYTQVTYINKQVSGVIIGEDKDNDVLTYKKESNPLSGTIIVLEKGKWTYTPGKYFIGKDTFKVKVDDKKGGTAISHITINVIDDEITAYKIDLQADPSKILGDGIDKSKLTAKVVDNNGKPAVGIEVVFTAEYGSFPNGDKAVTDLNGTASVMYQSEKIKGTEPVITEVKASVTDEVRNLYSEGSIDIIFEPAAIQGIVVDNESGHPVEDAVVEVSKDFNNDGIVDFKALFKTKKDGKYKIYVPEENVVYDLSITKPMKVGDEEINMTFTQKNEVGNITGKGGESFNSNKTATGIFVLKQPNGKEGLLKDYSKYHIDIYGENGEVISESNASINSETGIFHAENLLEGKDYKVALKREVAPNTYIIVGKVDVTINDDGEINISKALIDPYGTLTDSVTGEIIDGAEVKLYYANSKRNLEAGITPDTLVNLPIIDFPPSDNHNPQNSDEFGEYAYMVFPNTDYYVVSNKDGYEEYVSPLISVYLEIVKHDIVMDPINEEDNITPEEDKKSSENKTEEKKVDESKTEEKKVDENKTEETKKEETKENNQQKESSNKDEDKKDEVKVKNPKTGITSEQRPYLIMLILSLTFYGVLRLKRRVKKD